MAQNPSLNQLVTALNAAPHPAMGTAYFAHVGSYLALARSIPPAWFPKTGTATEAQIGGLIANLHSLTTVAWGAYPLNGAANMMAWMTGNGGVLLAAIDQACAAKGLAPGSGTMCSEIQAMIMLNYAEVTTSTAHAMFSQWTGFVEVEDLVQAEVLTTSGSDWAKLMSRALTFAAISCAKSVPESEPERAKLNTWCLRYKGLQNARTMARVGSLSPQSILLEPAVKAATKLLIGFPEHDTRGSLDMVLSAAVALQQQEKRHAKHWRVAEVQEALRAVLTCMESAVFGPLMGYGCPDRASLLIGQWAKTDANFKKWAEYMDVEDEVSPAWAYAESVVLTPLADWAGKVWKFWTLPGSPPPGTLEQSLQEGVLMLDVSHQLMRQQLHTLERKAARNRNRKRAECSSSSDESDSSSESEEEQEEDQASTKPLPATKPAPPNGPKPGGKKGGKKGGHGRGKNGKRGKRGKKN